MVNLRDQAAKFLPNRQPKSISGAAISQEFSDTPAGLELLRSDLRTLFQTRPAVTLAEIRDTLQMIRKNVVPLAEFWDAQKITIRNGDLRTAGPEL